MSASSGVLPAWTAEPLPGSKDWVQWRWSTLAGRSALLVTSSVRERAGLPPLTLAVPAVSEAFASELAPARPQDVQTALRGACRELLSSQFRAWSAGALAARWRVVEEPDEPEVLGGVEAAAEPLAALPELPEVVGVRSVDLSAYGLVSGMLACSDSTAQRGGLTVVAVIAVPGAVRRELLDLGDVDSVASFCEGVASSRGLVWSSVAGAVLSGAAALGLEVRPRG